MKIKEGHRRDFQAYLKWRRVLDFNPSPQDRLLRGESHTIKVFVEIESQGKSNKVPKHPRVLQAVFEGKASLNCQIKDWANGFYDCGGETYLEEMKKEYTWLPEWVWKAVRNQARI